MNSPYWFEIAVMFGISGVGGIVMAPFCVGVPIWLRLVKFLAGGAMAVLVSATLGRPWFFVLIGVFSAVFIVIHAWWLPKHGVNGWTAEPRERYDALRGRRLKTEAGPVPGSRSPG